MTLPAINALRKIFPDVEIDVLARKWSSPVYRYCDFVDNTLEFERPQGIAALRKLSGIARKIKGCGYDTAIVLPNSFESALIFKLAGIPRILGYNTDFRSVILSVAVDVPGNKRKRHEVFYYLNLVEKLFLSEPIDWHEGPAPVLKIPEDEKVRGERVLRKLGWDGKAPLIGINPGAAYGPAKRWPTDKYQELACALSEIFPSAILLVFGTNSETKIGNKICGPIEQKAINLCGKTTLQEAISIISMLSLMVSNDSGLMHVAAACDIPLVALFGSTNPVTTGPWSSKARIINHKLPCSPCLSRECPRDFICMLGISVQEVLSACKELLE